MSATPQLTILSVNYNSSEFLRWNLRAWTRLTAGPHRIKIVDNGSTPEELAKIRYDVQFYPNVEFSVRKQSAGGSIGHGEALNALFEDVDTPYTAIFDADCIPLRWGWDQYCAGLINDKVKIVGTPPLRTQKSKPIDFPLIYAIFFETRVLKDLKLDFRPSDGDSTKDTGWEIRAKLLEQGYQGAPFWAESTRVYQQGPFKDVICAEYYDNSNFETLLCSHLGRGSNAKSGKYGKGRPWDRYLEVKRYQEQKQAWLKKVESILQSESLRAAQAGNNGEEAVNCLVCQSPQGSVEFSGNDLVNRVKGWWTIVNCPSCGHAWTNPRPVAAEMGRFYPESTNYYQDRPAEPAPPKHGVAAVKDLILTHARRQHFGYHATLMPENLIWKLITFPIKGMYERLLLPTFPKAGKGRLLEIGCSTGTHLMRMKELGWEVEGLEFSGPVAEKARAKGLSVQTGAAEDANYAPQSFDAVVMSMVMEHLHDPAKVVARVREWVKPGGQFILSVPDFRGVEATVFRNYSYSLQLPTHLSHFSPASMRRLLQDWDVRILHQYLERDWESGMKLSLEAEGSPFWKWMKSTPRVLRRIGVRLAQAVMGSSRMVVHARKWQ